MTRRINDRLLNDIAELVVSRTGLYFPPERRTDLERGLIGAATDLNFRDIESCLQWMSTATLTRSQVETLASHLTVGETYFFRDQRTIDLLRHDIMPILINSHQADRRLRMWIAGCCTGEEAYTIAILLAELIPDLEAWDITLLATDINPRFLAKAAAGCYGEWSFRETPDWVRSRYFKEIAQGTYELCPPVKNMVTFAPLNLAEDAFPSSLSGTESMDLISCRNVLMYLHSSHLRVMSQQFLRCLTETGWLIVSPNDAIQEFASHFTAVRYCGSIAYQKKPHAGRQAVASEPALPVHQEEVPQDSPIQPESTPVSEVGIRTSPDHGPAATRPAGDGIASPQDALFIQSVARAYADRGHLDEALEWCDLAVAEERTNPCAHYLRATILQEQGALAEATSSLQTVLYLDPTFILAHVTLAFVALQLKQRDLSERHLENAKGLLASYPPELVLPQSGGITAGRMSEIIQNANTRKAVL